MIIILSFLMLYSMPVYSDHIRIIGEFNKRGIAKDFQILTQELLSLGHTVEHLDYESISEKTEVGIADVQIHIQNISSDIISQGRKNYLIPNPEFTPNSLDDLLKMDLILARTHEVERIFLNLAIPVFYLGFTSMDQKILEVKKNFRSFIHVKGFSPLKSTEEILRGWGRYFPQLIVIDHTSHIEKIPKNISLIRNYLTDEELKILQNRSGIHLCPSKTEGFGHYLSEAMSAGAVVITTDAPPMNEFITDARFLISAKSSSVQNYAALYHISTDAFCEKIRKILSLDVHTLETAGMQNRQRYFEKRSEFISNLKELFP